MDIKRPFRRLYFFCLRNDHFRHVIRNVKQWPIIHWPRSFYFFCYRSIHRWNLPYYRVKWFIQRGIRGYSDQDVNYSSAYISDVVRGILTQIAEEKSFFDYEFPGSEKEWTDHLRAMAQVFKKFRMDIGQDNVNNEQFIKEATPFLENLHIYSHPHCRSITIEVLRKLK